MSLQLPIFLYCISLVHRLVPFETLRMPYSFQSNSSHLFCWLIRSVIIQYGVFWGKKSLQTLIKHGVSQAWNFRTMGEADPFAGQ